MVLPGTAVFCTSAGKYSEQVNVLFHIEWPYFIVKHLGCNQRILAVIYFYKCYTRVSINEWLFYNPDDSRLLQIAKTQYFPQKRCRLVL